MVRVCGVKGGSGAGKDGEGATRLQTSSVVQVADVMLGVERKTELVYEVELHFEKFDVLLLFMHQVLEQIAADVILHGMAMRCRLLVQGARH